MNDINHRLEIHSLAQKRFIQAGCPDNQYFKFLEQAELDMEIETNIEIEKNKNITPKILDHYTVGWNKKGEICPVPVYAYYINHIYVLEALEDVIKDEYTLFIFDDEMFEGTSGHFGSWSIKDNFVHAKDNVGVSKAIDFIKRCFKTKN